MNGGGRRRRSGRLAASGVALALICAACGGSGPSGEAVGSRDADDRALAPAPPVVSETGRTPGPADTDGVVPVGYAHSRSGAAAAATTYLATLHRLVTLDDSRRRAALERMAAARADSVVEMSLEALEFLDAQVAGAREALPDARVFLREVPVAFELRRYTDDAATVSIWSVGVVLIEGLTEATEAWSTNTVELVWEDGDWRVKSWESATGPVPALAHAETSSPAEVIAAIGAWEGYRYVPSP